MENVKVTQNNRFIDWIGPVMKMKIYRVSNNFNKPLIEIGLPVSDNAEVRALIATRFVGQFAQFFAIDNKQLHYRMRSQNSLRAIGEIVYTFDNVNRLIKFSMHKNDQGKWWVHTVATDRHITVKFSQIREIVNRLLVKTKEKEEADGSVTWTLSKKIDIYETELVVSSGKNTKDIAISIDVRVNNAKAFKTITIKRTEKWEERLEEGVKSSTINFARVSEDLSLMHATIIEKKYAQECIDGLAFDKRCEKMANTVKKCILSEFEKNFEKDETIRSLFNAFFRAGRMYPTVIVNSNTLSAEAVDLIRFDRDLTEENCNIGGTKNGKE